MGVAYIHVALLLVGVASLTSGCQRRLDTFITLRNVNTIFADAAIYPLLKMYGSFEMPLEAKQSQARTGEG